MGFVTGILTHPTSGETYVRTDVAGIFRWDEINLRWVPLLDVFGNQIRDARNVESFAIDPNNANRLFAAYGTHVDETGGLHGILRSDDKGLSWTQMSFPSSVRMGGNSQWRHAGERLAVDPNNSNVVYFGSRQDGLWRSIDGGINWNVISGVPTGGNGVTLEILTRSTVASLLLLWIPVRPTQCMALFVPRQFIWASWMRASTGARTVAIAFLF